MLITRTSLFTHIKRTRDIPCTQEQYDAWIAGTRIQVAMPHLSDDDREFVLTGATPEEWDTFMRDPDDPA